MPDLDKKYIALIGAVLALAAAYALVSRQPQPPDAEAAAKELATQDLRKMIEEDTAAAKAQAEFNAMVRQAELEAADNVLNAMAAEPPLAEPLPVEEMPPSVATNVQAPALGQAAPSNVLSRELYVRGSNVTSGSNEQP